MSKKSGCLAVVLALVVASAIGAAVSKTPKTPTHHAAKNQTTPTVSPSPTASPTPTPVSVVTFSVTGPAPGSEFDSLNISYGSDTISDDGGTASPWSATLPYVNPSNDSNLEYNLSASLGSEGGSIVCSITVQGHAYSSTATGADEGCFEEVSPGLFGGWEVD